MIVITGAAGFIGSHLCRKLNFHGVKNLILVDDFTQEKKQKNWEDLEYADKIQREDFFLWAEKNVPHIDFIFHLGARTDYFSADYSIFEALNVDFSQRIWSFAAAKRIPFIYASSYLTNLLPRISHFTFLIPHFLPLTEANGKKVPLTSYLEPSTSFAKSKYIFDKWIEKQQQLPPFWAGLKFFQVYGRNEAHKAENCSNVYKFYRYYTENVSKICVEKNIIQDYIYVNDVVKVLYYFLNHVPQSGIYEVGTGFARPLQAIVDAINKAKKTEQRIVLEYQKEDSIVFQADLALLRKYAYKQAFLSLEQGVKHL